MLKNFAGRLECVGIGQIHGEAMSTLWIRTYAIELGELCSQLITLADQRFPTTYRAVNSHPLQTLFRIRSKHFATPHMDTQLASKHNM